MKVMNTLQKDTRHSLCKINNAAKTVDVDFNGKNVVLQKGIAQSLKDGERVLLAELGNVNINNNNVLVALLCSKGATSKVPTVSYDLTLITQLENQLKSREEKRYYICKQCNIEVTEETALLHDFICPECGEVYELQDNSKSIKDINLNINKITVEGHPVDTGVEEKPLEEQIQDLEKRFEKVKSDPLMKMIKSIFEKQIRLKKTVT